MKALNFLLAFVLVSSFAFAVSESYYTGNSNFFCGKEVKLINTGLDNGKGYAILSVNGEESKIYESDDQKVNGISIYVEGVSDDVGAQHDSAILSFGCKDFGKIGDKQGEEWFELKEGDSSFSGAKEFTVVSVLDNSIKINVNNDIVDIGLQERKSVGGLSILVDKINGKETVLRVKPATALGYVTGNSITGLVIGDIEFGLKSYFETLFSLLKMKLFSFS